MESLGEGWISSGIAVLAEWEGAVIPSCSASLTDVRPQCVCFHRLGRSLSPFSIMKTERAEMGTSLTRETMKNDFTPVCSKCTVDKKICRTESGRGPVFCPTLTRKAITGRANRECEKPEIREFARQASIQEGQCYANRGVDPYVLHPVKPRIQETWEFAKKMGFTKIGIAFCSGLQGEASTSTKILEAQGLQVVSMVCKAGRTPKEHIGIREEEKINIGKFESMCSPIAQAMILNEEETDFNILLGLCVGHDSLFLKYSEAFSTVLVVKDRVLGHNPAAALYTAESQKT